MSPVRSLLLLLALTGCPYLSQEQLNEQLDYDGDGELDDCDPDDPDRDEEIPLFRDADGDGFGDDERVQNHCGLQPGWVQTGGDCDDDDPGVQRTAIAYEDADADGFGGESSIQCGIPDGFVDNGLDCDDQDGGISQPVVYFLDDDGDGFGGPNRAQAVCALEPPAGQSANNDDCDDADSGIHPHAQEVCGDVDMDCDGLFDDDPDIPGEPVIYLPDVDTDGFGDREVLAQAQATQCPEAGWIPYTGGALDCDDDNAQVFPDSGNEACGGGDEDCDGLFDDDPDIPGDLLVYLPDADEDTVGDANAFDDAAPRRCEPLTLPGEPAYVVYMGELDCNDHDPLIRPGIPEDCSSVDRDCDGLLYDDPDIPGEPGIYLPDADGDSFGDAVAQASAVATQCPPADWLLYNGDVGTLDCNDASTDTAPGKPELCDGEDNNCNGAIDEELGQLLFWADADGDGAPDPDDVEIACAVPTGGNYLPSSDFDGMDIVAITDCNDNDAAVSPDADEIYYNDIDDDCDPDSDDDDQDSDGFLAVAGGGEDCDDTDPEIHPGGVEIWYDGVDQDCNPETELDQDGDGYVAASQGGDDCDDEDAAIRPDQTEIHYDDIDQDCDPTNENDADGDGFIAADFGGDDCDDASPFIYPGASEVYYDGIDQDCDDGNENDADGDGFDALAAGGQDCDDLRQAVNPGAVEIHYDDTDQDCDPSNENDADGDGYEAVATGGDDCNDDLPEVFPGAPEIWYHDDLDCDPLNQWDQDGDGALSRQHPDGTDCDDEDPNRFPDNPEVVEVENIDNNCVGGVGVLCTPDDDRDGYGLLLADPEVLDLDACPNGYTSNLSRPDCDDNDPTRHPGAEEICDGIDSDCDRYEIRSSARLTADSGSRNIEGDVYLGSTERGATIRICGGPEPVELSLRLGNDPDGIDLTVEGVEVNGYGASVTSPTAFLSGYFQLEQTIEVSGIDFVGPGVVGRDIEGEIRFSEGVVNPGIGSPGPAFGIRGGTLTLEDMEFSRGDRTAVWVDSGNANLLDVEVGTGWTGPVLEADDGLAVVSGLELRRGNAVRPSFRIGGTMVMSTSDISEGSGIGTAPVVRSDGGFLTFTDSYFQISEASFLESFSGLAVFSGTSIDKFSEQGKTILAVDSNLLMASSYIWTYGDGILADRSLVSLNNYSSIYSEGLAVEVVDGDLQLDGSGVYGGPAIVAHGSIVDVDDSRVAQWWSPDDLPAVVELFGSSLTAQDSRFYGARTTTVIEAANSEVALFGGYIDTRGWAISGDEESSFVAAAGRIDQSVYTAYSYYGSPYCIQYGTAYGSAYCSSYYSGYYTCNSYAYGQYGPYCDSFAYQSGSCAAYGYYGGGSTYCDIWGYSGNSYSSTINTYMPLITGGFGVSGNLFSIESSVVAGGAAESNFQVGDQCTPMPPHRLIVTQCTMGSCDQCSTY